MRKQLYLVLQRYFFGICLLLILTAKSHAQHNPKDSLLAVLKNPSLHDTLRLRTYLSLSEYYASKYQTDSILPVAEQAMALARKVQLPHLTSEAHDKLGRYYWGKSNLTQALLHLDSAIVFAKKTNRLRRVAQLQHTLGTIYFDKGDYSKATKYLYLALEIYNKQQDTSRIGKVQLARVSNDLGLVYHEQKMYGKAKELYQKNLDLSLITKDTTMIMGAYNNLAWAEYDAKNYTKALLGYKKALKLAQTIHHQAAVSLILNNMAECYIELDSLPQFVAHSQNALALAKKIGYQRMTAKASTGLGNYYLQKGGDVSKAILYLEEAVAVARQNNLEKELRYALEYLAQAYEKSQQSNKAFETFKAYIALRDTMDKIDNLKELLNKEAQFKEEQTRLEKEQREQAHQAELAQQRLIRNSSIAALLLMLGVAFFAYRAYRIKQKANVLLAEQKEKIAATLQIVEQQSFEIATKNNELVQVNEELQQQQEELLMLNENIEKQRKTIQDTYQQLKLTSDELGKSMKYASQMQQIMLADIGVLKQYFEDVFVIYKPRDVVSGDFYWSTRISEQKMIVVLADCTGHGVPGAFMSMLGSTLLHETINVKQVQDDPARILKNLHYAIRNLLKQDSSRNLDGMDISVCCFEKQNMTTHLIFAGAKTTMLVVEGEVLHTIHGDKQYLGGKALKHEFTNTTLLLPQNCYYYLFTDGFIDQNNAERLRLGTMKFKETLLQNAKLPLVKQEEELLHILAAHQQQEAQRDDITVIGLQL